MNTILRTVGGRFAQEAARKHTGNGELLDPKRGWSMMRDREIPVNSKALAVGLGVAATALLVSLEIPLETVISFFVPFAGFAGDMLFDGAELVLGPLLFGALLLPHLAPKPVRATVAARRVVSEIAPRRDR